MRSPPPDDEPPDDEDDELLPQAASSSASTARQGTRRRFISDIPSVEVGRLGGDLALGEVLTQPALLVEVDGEDQDRADGDVLPEGLDAEEDEAVAQDRRDEGADHGAAHPPLATEEAGAADDDRGDRGEVVLRVRRHRRGAEAADVEDADDARHQAHEHEHADELAVDVDARAAGALGVGAERVGPQAEARPGEDDPQDADDDGADDDEPRDPGDARAAELQLQLG